MAKDRDHKIVRALGSHPKAVPRRIKIGFCVTACIQVLCKELHDQAFNRIPIYCRPTHEGPPTR